MPSKNPAVSAETMLTIDVPAHAGVSPVVMVQPAYTTRRPRARGGEPIQRWWNVGLNLDVPAHAGVSPHIGSGLPGLDRTSPRTRG